MLPTEPARPGGRVLLRVLFLLGLTGGIVSCLSIPTPAERRARADALAFAAEWQATTLQADQFQLLAYLPTHIRPDPHLTVYIEGDGFAWVSSSTPSADPTPRDPVALRLALVQPGGNAVYLGRPCQYADAERSGCPQSYWTKARFAPAVVEASSMAIDHLKQRFGATRLTLVGYSGGAAVAALLAASRHDVERLITVAGNLDHNAWTRHHHIDSLHGSLNPADVAIRLAGLPQTHFVGANDEVIPLALVYHWPQAFLGPDHLNVRVIEQFRHDCCWVEQWKKLYLQAITE